jgi:hypothetical protein
MAYPWTYDEKTKTVSVHYTFNNKLTGLPADTKIINFKYTNTPPSLFNQPVYKEDLPPNVQCIKFGYYFNQPVNEDSFPSSITHLFLGPCFDQSLNELPDSITHLTMDPRNIYSKEINKLPNNLVFLELRMYYSQPINLPYGLKTLKIPKFYPMANIKVPFGCEIIRL